MPLLLDPPVDVAQPKAAALRTRTSLLHVGGLVVICSLAFFTGLGSTPLWEPDEPRFASATRHMIASGEYLDPTFNARPRWEKPVLLYWLQVVPMRLGFDPEWAARAPAAAAGVAAVLGVYWLGTLWWSSLAGLVAAAGLATTFRFAVYARQGLTDIPAVAGIVLTFLALEYATHPSRPPWRRQAWWAGWLVSGLTALIKGPLAAIAPVVWLVVTWHGKRDAVRWPDVVLGGLLAAVVGSSWYLYMSAAHGSSFLGVSIGYEVVQRYVDPSFPGPSRGPLFYWRILPGELAPWSLLVALAGVVLVSRGRSLDPPVRHGVATATAWFFGVMVLCSASHYKLPHYALPAYPAAFLLVGFVVDSLRDVRARRAVAIALGITACALVIASAIALAGRPRLPEAFRPGVTAVSAAVLVGGLAGLAMLRRDVVTGFLVVATAVAAAYAATAACILPALAERAYPYPALGQIVADRAAPSIALGAVGVHTALVYYARRDVIFLETPDAAARFLDSTEPRLTVLSDRDLERVRSSHLGPLIVIASRRQRNPRLSHLLDGRFVRGTGDVLLVGNQPAADSMRAGS